MSQSLQSNPLQIVISYFQHHIPHSASLQEETLTALRQRRRKLSNVASEHHFLCCSELSRRGTADEFPLLPLRMASPIDFRKIRSGQLELIPDAFRDGCLLPLKRN
jgi:hypothetical protein